MSDPIQFDPPEPSELSKLLDGYDVTSLIATGGMGAVYKATQLSLDRPVAIKLLPKEFGEDPSFRIQFEAEARSMAKLNHANLISIYDFGEAQGMPYIVMELVAGKSLYYSSYGKAIEQTTAVELVLGICRGLGHAHQAGIIHRDIKPANILLDSNAKPKIGDFGLASASDSESSEDGPVFGTPGYAAPEILSNPKAVGVPSDLYAVGVILYELLTGKMPEEPASPPSTIKKCDHRLDPIFKKATRRNPALRYQSAEEIAEDLQKILPTLGTSGQRALRPSTDRANKTGATTLKRRLSTDQTANKTDSNQNDSGKPKLVPLPKGGNAPNPQSRLKPLPASARKEAPAAPAHAPATPAVSLQTGSNWPIIRNLLIIAALVPVIIFTWGLYEKKQERIKAEKEEIDQKKKSEAAAREALRKKEERDTIRRAEEAEEEKIRMAAEEAERQRLLAIENAKTPMERLAEFRAALFNGRRDRFPDNTIDRSSHFLFFVKSPMTWTEAAEFAELHGAHLATPTEQADIDVLTRYMDSELNKVWIGGGAQGRGDWTWVTGEPWKFKSPATTLGSCASLSHTGVIRARPNAEKNPFVIQWSKDGKNPGSLASQLERLIPTLGSPSPAWPPTTVAHENRNFLLVQKPVSWDEADLIASSADGHLAVVSDPLEAIFLRKFMEASLPLEQSVWLGGRLKNDNWLWTTGENWEKAYWAPDSPDGGPSDRALRYLRASAGAGWDDANPKSGNADGFLIEWSTDSDRAPAPTQDNPGAASSQIAKLRGIGRRFVTKEVEDYRKFLLGNRDAFFSDVRVWYRLLSSEDKESLEEPYQALEENIPKDGDLSGEVNLGGLPAGVEQDFAKAVARQEREKKEFDGKLDALRLSYLNKLLALRDTFEAGGLKTQVNAINDEIEGVGQDGESFRAHFGQ